MSSVAEMLQEMVDPVQGLDSASMCMCVCVSVCACAMWVCVCVRVSGFYMEEAGMQDKVDHRSAIQSEDESGGREGEKGGDGEKKP